MTSSDPVPTGPRNETDPEFLRRLKHAVLFWVPLLSSRMSRGPVAEPFLGMMLTLDVRSIVQMASEMDEPRPRREAASRSISFEVLDADLLDALDRLVKLLGQPALVQWAGAG